MLKNMSLDVIKSKMPKTSCEIIFKNNNTTNVFYGGDTINGSVILTLYNEKIVTGIYITIIGNAECLWNENSGDKRIVYRGKECYLSTRIYFYGEEEGEASTLKPDVYKYNFKCHLPEDLPSSFEGTFGCIRYAAIVTIKVPIWPDKVYEKSFSVCKPVNLNEMFELKDSINVEKRKEFYVCCLLFCFKMLPLNIIAKLPATGFTPGQQIELTLEAENLSSKNVKQFNIEFNKIMIYKSNQMNSQRKAEKVRLSQYIKEGCHKNESIQYVIMIDVPSIPPTDLTSSSVCRVKYELQITAEVNCCHNSPELNIPITIGSIPFIENYHRLKRRPTIVTLDGKMRKNLAPSLILPSDLLIDNLPSYVLASGIQVNNLFKDERQQATTYIPMYPNFKN